MELMELTGVEIDVMEVTGVMGARGDYETDATERVSPAGLFNSIKSIR